ncbi:MAG TPA: ABC transporter permease [Candidatus Hydrogenedentes bacterium]|nr:ABC transporter permease [Candidatus Hydrogenedentota bacterium]
MHGLDHLTSALASIAQNKVRSLLTTLGVIIGVMSVILLIALGESAQAYVQKEFAILGSNILIITPGKQETTGLFPITAGSNRKLTHEIAQSIKRKVPGVSGVASNIIGLSAVRYGKRTRSVLTIGTTPDFDSVRQLRTQIGRFITDRDIERNNRVCIIGTTLKREIFGDEPALHKRVTVNGSKHMVVGILEERGMAMGIDLGDLCIIPLPSAQEIFNRKELWEILVGTTNQEEIPRVEKELHKLMMEAFDNNEDFTVTDQEGMLDTFKRIFDMLRLLLVGIASISLLVGGIGIMNIMLVSVRERTREVGVRMAIGARRFDIALQFLIESVTLSVMGGLIGIGLGALGSFVIHTLYPTLPIGLSLWSTALSFSFSLAVGVFFGVYPAVKAAGVDPVEALRYE